MNYFKGGASCPSMRRCDAQNEASIHFPPCGFKFQLSWPTVLGHPLAPRIHICIMIVTRSLSRWHSWSCAWLGSIATPQQPEVAARRMEFILLLPHLHLTLINISANEAKTQELMRERTTSHVKQLRIHEATVGKRRRANP